MTYTPYLIANFATGLDKRLQPWLIPDDAQEQLFDGFVYRGTMSKREGYNYFATGLRGGSAYRESRIVHNVVAAPATQVPNGAILTFTRTGTGQIARGSVTVNGSNPVVVGTDNGAGVISGVGIVTGSVNYVTGAISVTFSVAPAGASTVTFSFSLMPGNPVMMIANFITALNVRELIVADTQYVNRYNSTLNILQEIVPATTPYTGNKFQFFTWTNYASATSVPRLLFCNNKDVIQQYDGTVIIDYVYSMLTTQAVPVAVTTLTCSFMVEFKDRLILLRTTENGTIFPQRLRISGTAEFSDNFETSSPGAGVIDIPDGTWIQGATFSRDDLIIFTEASTWVLKYTGNDVKPFVIQKIDNTRGNDATFSAITYLNRSSAASRRGLIISDGYTVERQDNNIPDFTFNEVDGVNFPLCFAGSVDADKDHYLIYPPIGQDISRRILVTNYEEDNYSIYRLPLSCMGNYITAFTITWNDLLVFPTWDAMAAEYGNWYAFAYNSGAPFSVGGGHKGEIWKLSVTQSEDNIVRIYNITVIDSTTIEVTTDFNNYNLTTDDQSLGKDYIFLTGMVGMDELNNHQFPIIGAFISNNVFRLNVQDAVEEMARPATSFTPYVSGGTAQRVIPFSSLFKQFNPFIDQDKKVRCGWLYMYVNSTGTSINRNIVIESITNSNPAIVTTEVVHNLATGDVVNFFGIGGMTQLNGKQAFVTVLTNRTFSLNGIDSTAFGVYTSGGFASTSVPAKINIEVFTNDRNPDDFSQLNNPDAIPYEGNCTNLVFEDGKKKWYKVFINQVGKFIQFRFKNTQAGANISIQATMPGFAPLGRLI